MNYSLKKSPYLLKKGKKLFLYLYLVLFILIANKGFCQISVNVKNQPIREILKEIEKKSEYKFFYNADFTALNSNKDFSAENLSLDAALTQLLKNTGLTWELKESNLVVLTSEEIKKQRTDPSGSQKEIKVSGNITDALGESIPMVNILIKGTLIGTLADNDGNYSILIPADVKNPVLEFSFIGFTKKEEPVKNRSVINIALQEEISALDEVVVVGYGTQKKVSMTSAVAQIKSSDLTMRPTSNAQQALQGLSPGLTVTDVGGSPGRSKATLRVRGITTLVDQDKKIGTNDPLVLVDGIEQRFEDINVNDIESISILKDAASSSIYGSRAANGVILVTTKRAKAGDVSIKYNGTFSVVRPQNMPKHMGLEDYMRYQNLAYENSGAKPMYTKEYINEYVNATDRLKYPYPNVYFDEMYQNAPLMDNSISISGGSEKFKGLLSLRFKDEEGILSTNNNKVYGMRVNTDYKKSIFSFNADADYRYNYSEAPITNVINYIYHGSQWAVPRYPDGTYGISKQGNSPVLYNNMATSKLKDNYFVGNLKASADICQGLNVSIQYSAKITNSIQKDFSNKYEVRDYYNKDVIKKNVDKNSLKEIRDNYLEQTINGLINYEKQISNHNIKLLGGYSHITNNRNYLEGYKESFYNNETQSMSMGGEDNRKITGYDHDWGLRSFFGRANYNYQDKYLFEVNARWDGSSRFTGSGVYAFFPSVSGAWRVSQEKFWSTNNPVNDLKIRASWGKTGNQAIPLYEFYPALLVQNYTFDNEIVQGYLQKKMSNKDLTWETTRQTDIGLDASLLDSRLSITFDYYDKLTDGILLTLPIPGIIGLDPPLQNAGSVSNKGIELMLTWRDAFNDFSYSVSGNLAINKNKITDLAGSGPYKTTSTTDPMTIRAEGLPIDSHWGYKTGGLFQTQAEIDNYPTLFANSKPGDVKYIDLNEDGKITPEDMDYLGNTFPKYTFGLNSTFSYKGFDLMMQWQGAADVNVRLSGALIEMGNQEGFTHAIYTNNVWTPDNPNARFPRPVKFDLRNVHSSERVIFDGSYLRLKTLQLGYNLPQKVTRRFFANRAKVYISTTNLITFSKLNEWNLDPEFPSGRGSYYPQTSLTSLGINLEF